MRAKIKYTPNLNAKAIQRLLGENGIWLVRVHERRIVAMTVLPKGEPVEEVLAEFDGGAFMPPRDFPGGT